MEPKACARCTRAVHLLRAAATALLACVLVACGGQAPAASPSPSVTPLPTRTVHAGTLPVETGAPIALTELSGRILFDDFEDLFAMDVDGSNVATVAGDAAGPEFDGAWSPDGNWVVYRDSTRGINDDDEIAVARSDGSERRVITNDPANDWGPDWSPDGSTIAFNSDRDGGALRGWLVAPDGTNLRPMGFDAWVEYPSFSPDGTRIAFMGHQGSNYEIYVADIATGDVDQLTDSAGQDGWPSWSPDGSTIAFTSVRDDCRFAAREDRVLADRRRRRASRRLVDRPGRLEPAARHSRVRAVRRVVAGQPVPACLRPRAVRDPPGRHRSPRAARGGHRPSARWDPGLALTPWAGLECPPMTDGQASSDDGRLRPGDPRPSH